MTMAQVPNYGGQQEVLRPMGAASQEFYNAGRDMLNVPAASARGRAGLESAVDKITAKFDEARVLDVETQMRQYVVEQTYGDNGYTNLKGSAATQADEHGNGLAQRGLNGFDDKLQQITKDMGLTPHQMALARKQVAAIRGGFYNNMSAYAFQEAQNYEKETLSGGISQTQSAAYGDFAKPDAMTEGVEHIDSLVDRQAKLNGWAPEYTEQKRLEARSAYFANAMEGALTAAERDPRAAYYARDILQANRDQITGETAARYNARINTVLDNFTADTLVQGWHANAPSASTAAYKAAVGVVVNTSGEAKAAGGVNASVAYESAKGETQFNPDGTVRTDVRGMDAIGTGLSGVSAVAAKAAVEKNGQVWDAKAFANDKAYNNAAGALVMDSCVQAAAGDLTQAYAMYFSDEKTVKKAMEQAAKDGHPEDWLSNLPPVVAQRAVEAKEKYDKSMSGRVVKNGREVSAYEPGYAAASKTWRTRAQAERYVLAHNGRARVDPVWREKLVDKMMLDEARAKQDYQTEQSNLLAQVMDTLAKNGGDFSKVPPSLWGRLNPTQQKSVQETIKRVVTGVKEPDWNIYAEYKLNPERLAALSDDEFKNLSAGAFGNKADEMAYLRAATKQKQAMTSDAVAQGRRAADSGAVDYTLGPKKDVMLAAIQTFDPNFKADSASNNRRLAWLSQFFAEKVQRGEIGADVMKHSSALEHEIARIWHRDLYSQNGEFKFDSLNVKLGDLPNRGYTDAYRLIESLTQSRLGLTRKADERELDQTLFLLLNVKSADFGLSSASLPKLDTDVYNAACDALGVPRGTQTPEVYRQYLINRLYGLTSTAESGAVAHGMGEFVADY